jgi:hypothetical protein
MTQSADTTIPAPIGGWNARDPISAMPATDAVKLDNFIPGTGGVALRPGTIEFATGAGAAVNSLMEYNSPSGSVKLFAAASTNIFDVSSGGVIGAAVVTGLTNSTWQHTMFSTSGGSFLVICNGADSVRWHNGAAWGTPIILGATSSTFVNVAVHASRLWFVQSGTSDAWYLDTQSIAGVATKFPLGAVFKLGGYLVAIASWTRDGGSGPDDIAVFISSKGEIALYSGTDPSSTDTWAKVGTFKIGEPIGRRCTVKLGGDVGILTSQGLVPLSRVLPGLEAQQQEFAITNKIRKAFESAYRGNGQTFGWQAIEYAKGGLLIVNVPQGAGDTSVQYAMNTLTSGWCRLKDINATCWSPFGDSMYYGTSSGNVRKYDVDNVDDDTPITGVMMPAFQNFGTPMEKQFHMSRPLYTAAIGTDIPVVLRVEYDDTDASISIQSIPTSGTPWGSPWDSPWGPRIGSVFAWQGVEGIGQVAAILLGISSRTPLTFHQADLLFETGGPI